MKDHFQTTSSVAASAAALNQCKNKSKDACFALRWPLSLTWAAGITTALCLFPLPSLALTAGSALPRGIMPPAPKAAAPHAPKPNTAKPQVVSCPVDRADPVASQGFFGPDGRQFYYLADAGSATGPNRRFVIYSLALDGERLASMASMNSARTSMIVPIAALTGSGLAGLQVVAFSDNAAPCAAGVASVVTLALGKSAVSKDKGDFSLARNERGVYLVERQQREALEIDPQTLQKRRLVGAPAGESLLFVSPADLRTVTWRASDPRALRAYKANRQRPTLQLRLGPSEKILEDGASFAVTSPRPEANAVVVVEMPGWTNVDKEATYTVKLPPTLPLAEARLVWSAENSMLAAFSTHSLALFALDTASEVTTLGPLKTDQIIDYAGIAPRSGAVVAAIKDEASGRALALRIFDPGVRKWHEIKLPK